jgi:hypothetical protein
MGTLDQTTDIQNKILYILSICVNDKGLNITQLHFNYTLDTKQHNLAVRRRADSTYIPKQRSTNLVFVIFNVPPDSHLDTISTTYLV